MSADNTLLEIIADLAYAAGHEGYYSGDSRGDMANIVWLAKEFQKIHAHTDWHEQDYILAIDDFAAQHLHQTIFQS